MNDLALAVVAVEVVKKNMRDALVSDYRSNEKNSKKRNSILNLFL